MEISSSFNACHQKPKRVSFGDKYLLKDVLCIMSGSVAVGKQSDTFEQTVAGVLRKKIGSTVKERSKDYSVAKEYLNKRYSLLGRFADRYKSMLDSISPNHSTITIDDVQLVTSRIEKQYGSKFVDVV